MSFDSELSAEYFALEHRLRNAPSRRERHLRVVFALALLGLALLG